MAAQHCVAGPAHAQVPVSAAASASIARSSPPPGTARAHIAAKSAVTATRSKPLGDDDFLTITASATVVGNDDHDDDDDDVFAVDPRRRNRRISPALDCEPPPPPLQRIFDEKLLARGQVDWLRLIFPRGVESETGLSRHCRETESAHTHTETSRAGDR